MKKLSELMERKWMVGSFDGHAIFWNHASTFTTYAIADNGEAEEVAVNTSYAPDGCSETDKIRWAVEYGRELAAEYRKDNK